MFPPPPARSQYSVLIRVRVTELVEPVLVLYPFLVCRVDLPGLASKQASKQQASSTREMGQNQNSVVVLQIQVKFWWMIPMGVKYNHTKFEQENSTVVAGNGIRKWRTSVSKTAVYGQKQSFLGRKSPGTHSKRPNQGKRWVHFTCGLTSPESTSSLRPSNSMICPGNGPKRPPEAPNGDSHKPRIGHIFGYMAQNAISRAPTPPATPHFMWFPPLRIA